MNKVNDYETLLELANKDLKKYNMEINIVQTDCDYSVEIHNSTGDVDLFAEGYYEDELAPLINEAWVHARAKGEAERQSKLPKLDRTMHLYCESVQEITLYAWPIIWADNKYDQDSREVLEIIREWAWAFENWWTLHDEDWICTHDYIEEAWNFAERKCKEYLKELGVEPEPEQKEWIVRITRTETYSMNVRVNASTKEEAEEKVSEMWGDGDHDWLYETMTENSDLDEQTYDARPATSDDPDYYPQL